MKGSMIVELIDSTTGKVKEVRENNILTKALSDLYNTLPSLFIHNEITTTTISEKIFPIHEKYFGAVKLYSETKEAIDTNVYSETNDLLGYGRYNKQYAPNYQLYGDYIIEESEITDNSVKHVWQFNSGVSTGTIKSVCLAVDTGADITDEMLLNENTDNISAVSQVQSKFYAFSGSSYFLNNMYFTLRLFSDLFLASSQDTILKYSNDTLYIYAQIDTISKFAILEVPFNLTNISLTNTKNILGKNILSNDEISTNWLTDDIKNSYTTENGYEFYKHFSDEEVANGKRWTNYKNFNKVTSNKITNAPNGGSDNIQTIIYSVDYSTSSSVDGTTVYTYIMYYYNLENNLSSTRAFQIIYGSGYTFIAKVTGYNEISQQFEFNLIGLQGNLVTGNYPIVQLQFDEITGESFISTGTSYLIRPTSGIYGAENKTSTIEFQEKTYINYGNANNTYLYVAVNMETFDFYINRSSITSGSTSSSYNEYETKYIKMLNSVFGIAFGGRGYGTDAYRAFRAVPVVVNNFNTTINNLTTPIEKGENDILKISYTISEL